MYMHTHMYISYKCYVKYVYACASLCFYHILDGFNNLLYYVYCKAGNIQTKKFAQVPQH